MQEIAVAPRVHPLRKFQIGLAGRSRHGIAAGGVEKFGLPRKTGGVLEPS